MCLVFNGYVDWFVMNGNVASGLLHGVAGSLCFGFVCY